MKKTRVSKNGESPIYVRITYNGEQDNIISAKHVNNKRHYHSCEGPEGKQNLLLKTL